MSKGLTKGPSPRLRRERIADLVRRKGDVTVEDLALQFNTSHETVRRDLTLLADEGRVRKIHGGATRPFSGGEGGFSERMVRHAVEKRIIAEKAASLFGPGDTLFIDTGTTTVMCAEVLAEISRLTVFTNSTRIAALIAADQDKGHLSEVYLFGGRYEADNQEVLGPATVTDIGVYQADYALLTVGALSASGAMDFNAEEAAVARAMIARANKVVVLADRSKLNGTAAFRVCDLNKIDILITDGDPPDDLTQSLQQADVTIL